MNIIFILRLILILILLLNINANVNIDIDIKISLNVNDYYIDIHIVFLIFIVSQHIPQVFLLIELPEPRWRQRVWLVMPTTNLVWSTLFSLVAGRSVLLGVMELSQLRWVCPKLW